MIKHDIVLVSLQPKFYKSHYNEHGISGNLFFFIFHNQMNKATVTVGQLIPRMVDFFGAFLVQSVGRK